MTCPRLLTALAITAFLPASLLGQSAVYEAEPNNTPADANRVAGAVKIFGSMKRLDQDGFKWTVSDVDAQKRWSFELTGIPGKLTIVSFFVVEYADNGVDVAGLTKLFTIGSRDGVRPALVEDLVFEPGEYVLGVARGGGEGGYRPPVASVSFDLGGSQDEAPSDDPPEGYRLIIREGAALNLENSPTPRSSMETAFNLRPGAESAAFLSGGDSWFKLDINETYSAQNWDVTGQVIVGQSVTAFLRRSDGSEMVRMPSDRLGRFSFPGLGLETGVYYVEVKGADSGVRTLATRPAGHRTEGAEAEPNDQWSLANRADLAGPITGRAGKSGESDFFRFEIDQEAADTVLKLQLETDSEQQFRLCLLGSDGARLQCRTAKGTIELPDLVLVSGVWGLVVERGKEAAEYSVTLSSQGAIRPGTEAEPNDQIEIASGVASGNRIEGRFSGADTDFYKVLITDQPQLWRVQVIGSQIHEVAYHDGAGIQSQRVRAAPGQRRVRLEHVFLLPGTHHISVSGRDGGSYTLIARPFGQPDPNGEFEPNDDTSRMQSLRMGQTRTGVLEDLADRDNYRFVLAHWDRIRLTLQPPADGAINAQLQWAGQRFKDYNNREKGQGVVLEGLFPPGAYRLELAASQTSELAYQLGLERLERFGCPTDCEPNDSPSFASPIPASHVLEGRVNEWRDSDWYRLPVLARPTSVVISAPQRHNVQLVEREQGRSLLGWDQEAGAFTGTIPADTPTYLQIRGAPGEAYRLEMSFEDGPQAVLPTQDRVALAFKLEATEVAAYRQFAQRVAGRLVLTNPGQELVTVNLQTATSDSRWRVEFEEDAIEVPAAGSVDVAVIVDVPTDAWADWPVRVSVMAFNAGGVRAETSVDVTGGREAPPVAPQHGWTLPEELLGGFNVAWDALGGRWTGTRDTGIGTGFPQLFDGIAVQNQGLQLRTSDRADLAVTVELAGDQPVAVSGLALNLLAHGNAGQLLRDVDFSVSLDGVDFQQIYQATLLPTKTEQAFVFDQPVEARFARLRLGDSSVDRQRPQLTLGELKVIARPGVDISAGQGFNLADPALGGHVVWSWPQITGDWDTDILTESEENPSVRLQAGQRTEWVVGFHHNRAARITRLEWVHPPQATAEALARVDVAVSLDSPLGPWEPVGVWELSGSGSPLSLDLETPVWARFVKFSAPGPQALQWRAAPETLRIRELPTDGEYRSILAEWGFASQAAIYERLHPLPADDPFEAAGNDSRGNAAQLDIGQLAAGQVILGQHEHWYKLTIPAGENALSMALGGSPTVRTVVHLEDEAGNGVPVRKLVRKSAPRLQLFEAVVEPGALYYIKVEEPPRNVVFLWDTSASVGAWLPVIYNSMMAYAEDVVPGRDAANLIPFGGQLILRDWYGEPYILQTVLNDHPREENSSEAERTLHTASEALAPRAGTKAVVMVTDAATNRYPQVWEQFGEVRPRIFGLGVPSQGALGRNPVLEQDLMQDWSRVNGGHYTMLQNEGEMEVAFDRAATLLRRPADYTLRVDARFEEAPGPGTLTVTHDEADVGSAAVELILDASGSMLKRMPGGRRIEVAKRVLSEFVAEDIAAGTPVALRVFGHREANSCRTDLEVAVKPLDVAQMQKAIEGVAARNLAKTPIADSLLRVETDLKSVAGRKVIVLVTDGEETCDGDPSAALKRLADRGVDVRLNIVGFALDDNDLKAQFQRLAAEGGGGYFDADDDEALRDALEEAVQIPFTVYDQSGSVVATGTAGGGPVRLEQGVYRVSVGSDPPRVFERVEVIGERDLKLDLREGN